MEGLGNLREAGNLRVNVEAEQGREQEEYSHTVSNTKDTRAQTHRELIPGNPFTYHDRVCFVSVDPRSPFYVS